MEGREDIPPGAGWALLFLTVWALCQSVWWAVGVTLIAAGIWILL